MVVDKVRTKMNFPAFFPDDCPPPDCEDFKGVFYHFVRGKIDNPENFVPYAILENDYSILKGVDCQKCGLSMLRTLAAAELYWRMPNLRSKNLAKGTLSSEYGKLKNTPTHKSSEHYTFWVFDGINISQYFEVICESNNGNHS
jgi:hypothetical protein